MTKTHCMYVFSGAEKTLTKMIMKFNAIESKVFLYALPSTSNRLHRRFFFLFLSSFVYYWALIQLNGTPHTTSRLINVVHFMSWWLLANHPFLKKQKKKTAFDILTPFVIIAFETYVFRSSFLILNKQSVAKLERSVANE